MWFGVEVFLSVECLLVCIDVEHQYTSIEHQYAPRDAPQIKTPLHQNNI
jgi:hypothetical protein